MAKVKKTKKVSTIKRVATTKVDNKLSLLLIVLALLVFALAAMSMSSQGVSKTDDSTKVIPTATSSASPVAKTVK